MKPTNKNLDAVLPEVKTIESVMPELVRIAKEGDIVDRIVAYLAAQGWSEMDVWREIKKLRFVSSNFTLSLQNKMQDLGRYPERPEFGRSSLYADLANDFKQLKKQAKK